MSNRSGRILEPPPKARGNGARLCAEHQPQRHSEATRFGIIRRLWASALAAAGPSDTAAVRRWFQDTPLPGCRKTYKTRCRWVRHYLMRPHQIMSHGFDPCPEPGV